MNRTFTALALSTLFAAAPAFARQHVSKAPVAGDTAKAPAGETKPAEGAKSDTAAAGETKTEKPAKKSKKSAKKAEKTEAAPPAEAPAK